MKKLNLLLFVLLFSGYAISQERSFVQVRQKVQSHIALVVGNSNYPDMPLANPKNDAVAVAQTFIDMGFIVEKVIDADKEQMATAIKRFRKKLATAKVAVFYFAGHGIQVKGENYLIPIGRTAATQIETEAQVPYRAINAGEILSAMEQSKVKFSMVVLDACRNNPIKGTGRGKTKGLASIDAPVGSIVMYATKSGDIALDGTGKNSPFTSAFIKHVKTPGLDVNLLPSRVTKTVLKLTNNRQTPGTYVQLTESFVLVPEYTAKEIKAINKLKQGKLTDLQKQQAEMDKQKLKENAELAEQQAQLEALDRQIIEMKQQLNNGGGDLDKMLAIVEKQEKQKAKLEAMKKRIESERKAREEKIKAIKEKDFEENLAKYNKIANSEFGKKMKNVAWNSLLDKYNIPRGSIAVGKIYALKYAVLGYKTPKMVFIKGGTFPMGSHNGIDDEQPVHSVTVDDFYIGKYEVTVAEFEVFINATGYKTEAEKNGYSKVWTGKWEKGDGVNWRYNASNSLHAKSEYNHPVIHVSWNDAVAYCKWLSKIMGKNYRLPTEAEWEYAAGNGIKDTKYSWGNKKPTGENGGNVADETAKKTFSTLKIFDGYTDGYVYTAPVGQYKPNEFSLHEMTGNVLEWCNDWYGDYSSSSQNNPKGSLSGSYRIIRGGSWSNNAAHCRVSYRYNFAPSNSSNNIGFRVVHK